MKAAHAAWGCNCGPSALAFALQKKLDEVRPALPLFAERRYTNPTMMRAPLAHFAPPLVVCRAPLKSDLFHALVALVRVQWRGPWTDPQPTKWAARYTHWFVTWLEGESRLVFDCNGGIQHFDTWEKTIPPAITAQYKNASGA